MDSEKYSSFRYSHLYMDVDLLQLESGTRKVIETCLTSLKLRKMEWNSQNSRQWVKYFCYSKQQYCGSASLQWECKFYSFLSCHLTGNQLVLQDCVDFVEFVAAVFCYSYPSLFGVSTVATFFFQFWCLIKVQINVIL